MGLYEAPYRTVPVRRFGLFGQYGDRAHNYESHFGQLKNLSQGEQITFTDIDGNCFCYQVLDVEILSPYDVQEMTEGAWDLTLFTCTIGRTVTRDCSM